MTLAYETLIDAKRRADYDRSYGSGTAFSSRTAPAEEGAHFDAPAAGSRASAHVRRPNTPRNTAADAPVYVPSFEEVAASGEVPLIPEPVARQQVHGMPRKRGLFGAEARIQREMRTVQLITRQILPAIPAARLVNGLQSRRTTATLTMSCSPATGWPSSVRCSCRRAPTPGTAAP